MLRKMLLSGVALIGLTGLASAADLAFKAPPPVYVPTWTGCYIGGHAGYGQTTSSSSYNAPLKLSRFRGHPNICVQGAHDGEDETTLHT
jgi:opacity protein-like surface antigen